MNLPQNLTLVNDDWVAERIECDPDWIVHVLPGGEAVIFDTSPAPMPATIENTPRRFVL